MAMYVLCAEVRRISIASAPTPSWRNVVGQAGGVGDIKVEHPYMVVTREESW